MADGKTAVGPLKNARHERFAQELAKGKSQSEAYKLAGYDATGNAAETAGARLVRNVQVAARVEQLKERAAEKATTTAVDIARQLDEDRAFARDKSQAAAAVSATMGKAKVLGLIIDQRRNSFDFSNLSDDELAFLENILAKSPNA